MSIKKQISKDSYLKEVLGALENVEELSSSEILAKIQGKRRISPRLEAKNDNLLVRINKAIATGVARGQIIQNKDKWKLNRKQSRRADDSDSSSRRGKKVRKCDNKTEQTTSPPSPLLLNNYLSEFVHSEFAHYKRSSHNKSKPKSTTVGEEPSNESVPSTTEQTTSPPSPVIIKHYKRSSHNKSKPKSTAVGEEPSNGSVPSTSTTKLEDESCRPKKSNSNFRSKTKIKQSSSSTMTRSCSSTSAHEDAEKSKSKSKVPSRSTSRQELPRQTCEICNDSSSPNSDEEENCEHNM